MAEHAQRMGVLRAGRDEPRALSGPRHEMLQRRAAQREAGYGALLNSRPRGPQPIQRRAMSGSFDSVRSDGVGAREGPAGPHPVQRVQRYGDLGFDLRGEGGDVHLHYLFDDADCTTLHLTLADQRDFGARTWASRRSYTPTSAHDGNWTNWASNHGVTPPWAINVAGDRGRQEAEAVFHANPQIAALLQARWPAQALNIADPAEFPALGPPQAVPANAQPPAAAAPLNPNAPAFVPRRLNPNAAVFVPSGS